MHKVIILVGIKHCGKSSQGKLLAKRLECPFFDTDDIIMQMTGKTPRTIYLELGSQYFMQAEAEACRFLLDKKITQAVIATGGGICNNTQAITLLKKMGKIVFLEIPEKDAADRIIREIVYKNGKMTELPAYIAKENPQTEEDVRRIFSAFYKKRTALYKQIADATCFIDSSPKNVNAEKIWATTKKLITVATTSTASTTT